MKKFLQELGVNLEKYVPYCGDQSAIHLAKNSTFHAQTKHVYIRYHWIRDVLESKLLYLDKIHTNQNGSDIMTKVVTMVKLDVCRKMAGLSKTFS